MTVSEGLAEKEIGENFDILKFEIFSEPMQSVWAFKNQSGKSFKLSTNDLVMAYRQIIDNWAAWERLKLNENNINPDETLYKFSERHFRGGSHKDIAETQRRGTLHLISALAYFVSTGEKFDKKASQAAIPKKYYENALQYFENAARRSEAAFSGLTSGQASNGGSQVKSDSAQIIGKNELFYGAPGTGKSYSVEEKLMGQSTFRTVFHPDMQNSDFFGSLKPKMVNDKVAYAFSPGPFSNALKTAYEKPDEHHYLVIEELNRAPAAAVFGELFQLLDRDDRGESRYEVDVPSEDAEVWFGRSKLKLPANLSILATMNSADQGVFPLDTAFRRRWSQKYFPLYGDTSKFPHGDIKLAANDGELVLEWRQFVRCLNEKLIELGVAEDRLMGIWFVRENELNGPIPMKVLLYLWDDVLRHQDRNAIFNNKLRTFGDINSAIDTGKPILADDLLSYMKGFAEQSEDPLRQSENDAEDNQILTKQMADAARTRATSDDDA